MKENNPIQLDLKHIARHCAPLWKHLSSASLFITGGTGFFGRWILESLLFANETLNLNIRATILSRNPDLFAKKHPQLGAHPDLTFIKGDIRNFTFPTESFDYVIHGATEASAHLNLTNPSLMYQTIVEGTHHLLEFVRICQPKTTLFFSSGAVYGKQPQDLDSFSEDYSCTHPVDHENSAHAMGKAAAEDLCQRYIRQHQLDIKIARCFAFVGPYIPLNTHFAIGNFLLDGIKDNPIIVKGDGTTLRSYLYIADLMIWMWTILLKGQSGRPYNVGSDVVVSIGELAKHVSEIFTPMPPIIIAKQPQKDAPVIKYIPNIDRARTELSLKPLITLSEALEKTKKWIIHSRQTAHHRQ